MEQKCASWSAGKATSRRAESETIAYVCNLRYYKKMATSPAESSRRDQNKQLRRQRILDAACELMRESAEGTWTVERVAERAGVVPRTVFNLVGTRDEIWGAIADRLVEEADAGDVPEDDPQGYARKALDEMICNLTADAVVCRALIAGWSHAAGKMHHSPIHVVLESLRVAQRTGVVAPGVDVKLLSAQVGDAIAGLLHQWGAELISSRTLRARCQNAVDIGFAAARPDGASPRWNLGRPTIHSPGGRT